MIKTRAGKTVFRNFLILTMFHAIYTLDPNRPEIYEVRHHFILVFFIIEFRFFYEKEVRLWKNPREHER